jgi:hypothetical protein
MENCHATKKDRPAYSNFFAAAFGQAGLPGALFRSLASFIGKSQPRTKLCPFCEETLLEEALTCRFCNRILMRQMNLKKQ